MDAHAASRFNWVFLSSINAPTKNPRILKSWMNRPARSHSPKKAWPRPSSPTPRSTASSPTPHVDPASPQIPALLSWVSSIHPAAPFTESPINL
ncbi:hypothetical protein ACFX2J_016725 [Malus domestica]